MLHTEVAESPAAQHDKAFQNDVFVYFPSARGDMEDCSVECIRRIARHDKRNEDERREERVEKQYRNNSVT